MLSFIQAHHQPSSPDDNLSTNYANGQSTQLILCAARHGLERDVHCVVIPRVQKRSSCAVSPLIMSNEKMGIRSSRISHKNLIREINYILINPLCHNGFMIPCMKESCIFYIFFIYMYIYTYIYRTDRWGLIHCDCVMMLQRRVESEQISQRNFPLMFNIQCWSRYF